MVATLALPVAAQTCPNQGGTTIVEAVSSEEPGDTGVECFEAEVPKGRRFIAIIYDLTFSDHVNPPAGRADSRFDNPLTVTVGGMVLHEVPAPAATDFTTPPETYTDSFGRIFLNYSKHVEKILDVTALAASAPAAVRIDVRGRNITSPPRDAGGFRLGGAVHTDIRFTLIETPYSFRPKDASDAPATSGCQGDSDPNCLPAYTAELVYGSSEAGSPDVRLNGKIRFILQKVSALTGNSTNSGTGSDPDYKIEQSRQSQGLFETLTDTRAVTRLLRRNEPNRAVLKVTSLDYGGKAELKAEYIPGGGEEVLKAQIDATAAGAPSNQPAQPNCECASLPYDSDGNDIADSWEDDELGVGNRIAATEDTDPGLAPTSPQGDGIVAKDEYRGFHYIERAGVSRVTKWARLKPRVQDVFYFDSDSAGRFGDAVRALLETQTLGWQRYREVDATQGKVVSGGAGGRINTNSASSSRSYALIYRSAALPPGVLGRATDKTLQNKGLPIEIDLAQIGSAVAVWGWCVQSSCQSAEATLLAVVVAHETGHQFGQRHPTLNSVHKPAVSSPPMAGLLVPQSEYGMPVVPGPDFFVRLEAYRDLVGNLLVADKFTAERTGATRPASNSSFSLIAGQGTASYPALSASLPPPSLDPGIDTVFVNYQEQRIMDWNIRRTLSSVGLWSFSQRHLRNFCVHPQCKAAFVF